MVAASLLTSRCLVSSTPAHKTAAPLLPAVVLALALVTQCDWNPSMNTLKGFSGFAPMNQIGGTYEESAAEQKPATGGKVFDQILQQMKTAQQGQKTAMKSKVDMLWPMGTVRTG